MYTVRQYRPQLSVIAWHGKTRYDLTGYVLEATTHKAFGEPMGQWALLLRDDRPWHRILQPMDYVEISMSRYAKTPQIIMRGFVSNVRLTRVMDASGKPKRTITVNGNDYGKLYNNYQVYYAANEPGQVGKPHDYDPAQGLLTPMASANLGLLPNSNNDITPLSQLVAAITKGPIYSWIEALRTNTPAVPRITPVVNLLSSYAITWLSIQSMQGSLGSVIDQYANTPWCEWFVYDAPNGPQVIHRNAPYKDSSGKYIFSSSTLGSDFATLTISDKNIIQDDIGATDNEAYDYFFTYPSMFTGGDLAYKYDVIGASIFGSGGEFGTSNPLQVEGTLGRPTNPKFIKSSVYLYGLNIMEIASPAIPVLNDPTDPQAVELSIQMNMWLARAFGWGPQMLNGTINMQGDERATIGRYVYNADAGYEAYIESVDQTFSVSQPGSRGDDNSFVFTTSLGVTRGRYTTRADHGVDPATYTQYYSTPAKSTTTPAKGKIYPTQ